MFIKFIVHALHNQLPSRVRMHFKAQISIRCFPPPPPPPPPPNQQVLNLLAASGRMECGMHWHASSLGGYP